MIISFHVNDFEKEEPENVLHSKALSNGMCIMNPVMVEDKIYYRTQQHEEKKMKVFM